LPERALAVWKKFLTSAILYGDLRHGSNAACRTIDGHRDLTDSTERT
jgi:hypothetical protein